MFVLASNKLPSMKVARQQRTWWERGASRRWPAWHYSDLIIIGNDRLMVVVAIDACGIGVLKLRLSMLLLSCSYSRIVLRTTNGADGKYASLFRGRQDWRLFHCLQPDECKSSEKLNFIEVHTSCGCSLIDSFSMIVLVRLENDDFKWLQQVCSMRRQIKVDNMFTPSEGKDICSSVRLMSDKNGRQLSEQEQYGQQNVWFHGAPGGCWWIRHTSGLWDSHVQYPYVCITIANGAWPG